MSFGLDMARKYDIWVSRAGRNDANSADIDRDERFNAPVEAADWGRLNLVAARALTRTTQKPGVGIGHQFAFAGRPSIDELRTSRSEIPFAETEIFARADPVSRTPRLGWLRERPAQSPKVAIAGSVQLHAIVAICLGRSTGIRADGEQAG